MASPILVGPSQFVPILPPALAWPIFGGQTDWANGRLPPVRTAPWFGPPRGSDHPPGSGRTALRRTAPPPDRPPPDRPPPDRPPPDRPPPDRPPPKISLFFFPSPRRKIRSFLLSLGGRLVEFWWCLKRRGAQMCTFGVLRLSCASPGGPVWWGRRGFTRQPESPNVLAVTRPSRDSC